MAETVLTKHTTTRDQELWPATGPLGHIEHCNFGVLSTHWRWRDELSSFLSCFLCDYHLYLYLPDAFLYRCLNNCFLFFIFSFLLQGVWSGVFLASSDSVTDMPGIYLVLEYIYADTHLSPLEETTWPDHRPWCHYQEYDLYSTWP